MLTIFIMAFVGVGLTLISTGGIEIWFGLFFAVFGGGMGVAAFCLFVQRVQIILDHPGNSILIRRQSVFGYKSIEHTLSDLAKGVVQSTTSRSDGRTSTLYRAVLILDKGMSAGEHPIVEAYVGGPGPQRLADAVNEWLPARRIDSDTQ
ncbi:MAG: hypothetical protein ACU0BB_14890 [Paracoccaceae bacterium]